MAIIHTIVIKEKFNKFIDFDLLKFSLRLLEIINLHPYERKLNLYTINKFMLIFSASMLLLLTIINFIVDYKDIEDFVRKVESICTLLQVRRYYSLFNLYDSYFANLHIFIIIDN